MEVIGNHLTVLKIENIYCIQLKSSEKKITSNQKYRYIIQKN
jgi:hypothetical protein